MDKKGLIKAIIKYKKKKNCLNLESTLVWKVVLSCSALDTGARS